MRLIPAFVALTALSASSAVTSQKSDQSLTPRLCDPLPLGDGNRGPAAKFGKRLTSRSCGPGRTLPNPLDVANAADEAVSTLPGAKEGTTLPGIRSKKGMSWCDCANGEMQLHDFTRESDIGWTYNWRSYKTQGMGGIDRPYLPMLWGDDRHYSDGDEQDRNTTFVNNVTLNPNGWP